MGLINMMQMVCFIWVILSMAHGEVRKYRNKDKVVAVGKLPKVASIGMILAVLLWSLLVYSLVEETIGTKEVRAHFSIGLSDYIDTSRIEGIVEESEDWEKVYAEWGLKQIKDFKYLLIRVIGLCLLFILSYKNMKFRIDRDGIRTLWYFTEWDKFKSFEVYDNRIILNLEYGKRMKIPIRRRDKERVEKLLKDSIQ